jgi:mannose/fructose/N-acetylgalactosamine-specific phosphotransferase system component IIC
MGLLLGDLPGGIMIGILLQLMYLWVMPIGTAVFPDPGVGAVVGSSGFIMLCRLHPDRLNLNLLVIIIFVIPFSLVAGWSQIKQRQLNSRLLSRADLYAKQVKVKGFSHLFWRGLAGSLVRGALVSCSGMICVMFLLRPLTGFFFFVPDVNFGNMEIPIWGWGIGTMIHLFGRKRNLLWILGGAGLGILMVLL